MEKLQNLLQEMQNKVDETNAFVEIIEFIDVCFLDWWECCQGNHKP